MEIKPINAETPYRGGVLATNITHEITKDSPLYGLMPENYSVDVYISGYDEQLGEIVHKTGTYQAGDFKIGYEFGNTLCSPMDEVLKDSSRHFEIDANKLGNVQLLEEKWREKLLDDMERAVGRKKNEILGEYAMEAESKIQGSMSTCFSTHEEGEEHGHQYTALPSAMQPVSRSYSENQFGSSGSVSSTQSKAGDGGIQDRRRTKGSLRSILTRRKK